jgi:hypothetical protein
MLTKLVIAAIIFVGAPFLGTAAKLIKTGDIQFSLPSPMWKCGQSPRATQDCRDGKLHWIEYTLIQDIKLETPFASAPIFIPISYLFIIAVSPFALIIGAGISLFMFCCARQPWESIHLLFAPRARPAHVIKVHELGPKLNMGMIIELPTSPQKRPASTPQKSATFIFRPQVITSVHR